MSMFSVPSCDTLRVSGSKTRRSHVMGIGSYVCGLCSSWRCPPRLSRQTGRYPGLDDGKWDPGLRRPARVDMAGSLMQDQPALVAASCTTVAILSCRAIRGAWVQRHTCKMCPKVAGRPHASQLVLATGRPLAPRTAVARRFPQTFRALM